jgi:dTDP-D-glucose 4,6-dehydratase
MGYQVSTRSLIRLVLSPQVPFDEGIRRTVAWYKEWKERCASSAQGLPKSPKSYHIPRSRYSFGV